LGQWVRDGTEDARWGGTALSCGMHIECSGDLWFWRGPAPWHFVTVPDAASEQLAAVSDAVSYGWGMIPARVTVGATAWSTALWPKDGGYIVPIKTTVRTAERLELGDTITLQLDIAL
jgi:hypothetical protein